MFQSLFIKCLMLLFCLISVGIKMQMLRERDILQVKVTAGRHVQTIDRQAEEDYHLGESERAWGGRGLNTTRRSKRRRLPTPLAALRLRCGVRWLTCRETIPRICVKPANLLFVLLLLSSHRVLLAADGCIHYTNSLSACLENWLCYYMFAFKGVNSCMIFVMSFGRLFCYFSGQKAVLISQ